MKSTILFFGLILTLPLLSSAQDTERLEIPLISIEGHSVLELLINGKGPFRFIFDTGKMGGELATDLGVTEKFNFIIVDSIRIGDPTGLHDVILPVVQIPEVKIGRLTFENVNATVNPGRMPGINGIIGLAFFKDYLVTLDLSGNKITLTRGELDPPDGNVVLAYEDMMGVPKVQVTICGFAVDAHIDCGNARSGIVVPQFLADKLAFSAGPVVSGMAHSAFNEIQMKQGTIKGRIVVGGYSFDNPMVSFPAFGDFLNLGEVFLRQFILTFDQKNQRLKILKSTEWKN